MRNAFIAFACGAAIIFAAGTTASAHEPEEPVVLADTAAATVTREVTEAGAVVTRTDHHTALGGQVTTRTYSGEHSLKGADSLCSFTSETTEPADSPVGVVYEEREILFDETNCTLTTEIGEQIVAEAKQEGHATSDVTKNPGSTVGGLESQASSRSLEAPVAAASATRYAYLKTYYEDAVNIDLNSVTARVKWTYNGSCVTASSNHTASYGWFTTTHWQKHYSTVTSGRSCSEAYTRAVAHFSNPPGFVGCATT
jgi:hypothetical protein